ncbi:MAG: hypothetical protein NXH95_01610 [Pseudomonadaceae bacterium]|nr:hypothetical protein [Pseudomonadaceae bacterium]
MQNLIGKQFTIDQRDYAVVDVRNIRGDAMVYAEPLNGPAGPARAAFRYVDIETTLIARYPTLLETHSGAA